MPLFATREEALNAPGWIYTHFKGGVYRRLMDARDTTTDPPREVVVYEHLWPHQHGFWTRPIDEFEGVVGDMDSPTFEQDRFALIKKDSEA